MQNGLQNLNQSMEGIMSLNTFQRQYKGPSIGKYVIFMSNETRPTMGPWEMNINRAMVSQTKSLSCWKKGPIMPGVSLGLH